MEESVSVPTRSGEGAQASPAARLDTAAAMALLAAQSAGDTGVPVAAAAETSRRRELRSKPAMPQGFVLSAPRLWEVMCAAPGAVAVPISVRCCMLGATQPAAPARPPQKAGSGAFEQGNLRLGHLRGVSEHINPTQEGMHGRHGRGARHQVPGSLLFRPGGSRQFGSENGCLHASQQLCMLILSKTNPCLHRAAATARRRRRRRRQTAWASL